MMRILYENTEPGETFVVLVQIYGDGAVERLVIRGIVEVACMHLSDRHGMVSRKGCPFIMMPRRHYSWTIEATPEVIAYRSVVGITDRGKTCE
jgi:hypothetical protein